MQLRPTVPRPSAAVASAADAAAAFVRPQAPSALSAGPGEHRRIAVARCRLDDFRQLMDSYDPAGKLRNDLLDGYFVPYGIAIGTA